MARIHLTASRIALIVVAVGVGGLFLWWYQNRPSYLLYQAHQALGEGNEAGVISEYKRLLSAKDLKPEDETRFRKALGEFYVRALQETNGVSTLSRPAYEVENPFIAQAKKEFDRVLVLSPQDATAHYYMGRILWMQRLESFAIQELEKSRQFDPKNPEPLWFLARVHLERGEASQARELALQALAIRPDYDEARMVLVESYAGLGDHDNALKEFDRLSSSFKNNPDTQAQHALYLAEQNQWPSAEVMIEKAVAGEPNNGRVKIIYGRILLERGQIEAAGQFAQAGALMPRSAWPLVWQVKAAWRRGQCDEAARISQLLVEGLPRWGWSHLARGWSNLCRGEVQPALNELEEAERLSPDLMEAKELRAQISLDMERFDEAGKIVRPLLDNQKNESTAYALLAQSFLLQRNYAMAVEMAEMAIKINQQNAPAFLWLALGRAGLKDNAGARRAFDNAGYLRPDDPIVAAYGLSSADDLRSLTKLNGRSGHLWFLLGEACRRDKNWPDAVDAYQNALAIEPWLARAQWGLKEALKWRDQSPK